MLSRKVSFVMANAAALLLLAAICVRLARHWNSTSSDFHFYVLFLVGSFPFLWVSLLRDKSCWFSWANLSSLGFSIVVLYAVQGAISH